MSDKKEKTIVKRINAKGLCEKCGGSFSVKPYYIYDKHTYCLKHIIGRLEKDGNTVGVKKILVLEEVKKIQESIARLNKLLEMK